MKYEKSVSFHGDAGKALDFVSITLVSIGFNLVERTPTTLIATAPPAQPNSGSQHADGTNQSNLTFIKRIEVRVEGAALLARGQFGRGAVYFLGTILGGSAVLCAIIAVVMFSGAKDEYGRTAPHLAGFLPLAIAIFLFAKLPSMPRFLNNLGHGALDALVINAAAMAENKES